ncbi:MAG: glycoside hydrolase family 3 C-terminal domain-containing protein [Pseudomonadales bacterium]|nr:glycoside hydrolase family 3 C-terminal domain-containing protein [Pseudomonadales bacterium]
MLESIKPNRAVKAFDRDQIHAGNIGLSVDHEAVQVEVDRLLSSMTLAQKINEMRGLQAMPIDGLYYAGGDETLGIPPYKMVDGPRGARTGVATAFPVAMARGATFDAELERRVGLAIGLEVAARGGNVLLAPTINLLRHPGWGRAQETYSEDPCHMGALSVAFVSGAQNHVLTSPKHFALNNLELTRFEMSSNVDVRTLHEVYLPHFKRCVVEGAAASVMSAYNKMNGVYCGEHPELLTDILRDDWGFSGFVESDWFLGTRSTAPAINAGMDIEMPAPYRYSDEKLEEALANGEIDEEVITRNASRALYQKVAYNLAVPVEVDESIVECEAHIELAREVAEKSFVLLKNEDVLPLATSQKIAVIGDLAAIANLGDRGSSMVTSTEVTTPLTGLQTYSNELELTFFESTADLSSLGEFDVALVVAGLTYREEGEFIPTQQQEAEDDSEFARGGDRMDLRLPVEQEALIKQVAQHQCKTVVLLEGGSAVEVSPWSDEVDALMMIWYPGREGGHALARVLFGDVDASGRLPVSFPRSITQLMDWDINALDVPHDLFHGYRYLDRAGERAQFPFGFGLSYTQFSMDGLQAERTDDGFLFNVSVTNTGARPGVAVPQLYAGCPDSRVLRVKKELKGFGRLTMEPGESVDLEIEVLDADLHYFDPDDGWTLEPCLYQFHAGFSADELILDSPWQFDGEDWEPQ